MLKKIFFIILFLKNTFLFANINYINYNLICSDKLCLEAVEDIKNNQKYYNHWTPNWDFEVSKDTIKAKLKSHYNFFSKKQDKNIELSLLLADICHYLYNLEDSDSYKTAVEHYNEAITAAPQDYRCYWFLANHFAFSNQPNKAILSFKNAELLLPKDPIADFWNEYAYATSVANMPTHCVYAMDKAKSLLGKTGYFEDKIGKKQRETVQNIDKKNFYKKTDLWRATQKEEQYLFISRPFGMKITIDSSWIIAPQDYKQTTGLVVINPTPIKNKKGKPISYTIAIIIKPSEESDNLDDFINIFTQKYKDKNKIILSEKYDKMIAYEIKEKNMYQNMGGGHLYTIGIERNQPQYAGKAIEEPMPIPNSNGLQYLKPAEIKNRFKGKIFYGIILDVSEEIHDEAFATFKNFFEQQLIIE